MSLKEITPRSAFSKILIDKPPFNFGLLEGILATLPLKDFSDFDVLGTGDWGRSRSGGGSVVVLPRFKNGDGWVVKIPLGDLRKDPLSWAVEQADVASKLEMAPPTHIVVVGTNERDARPVVFQQKVDGKPACETPFLVLFKPEILKGAIKLIKNMWGLYQHDGARDLCGQRFSSVFWSACLGFFHFFSDNIMIVDEQKVVLVDNVPEKTKDNIFLEGVHHARFAMSFLLISLFFLLRKGYDRVNQDKNRFFRRDLSSYKSFIER